MSFGDRLFQLRKERGLSLRELAEKVGIDYSLLSKIENDLRPDPEADLLFSILDALSEVKPVSQEEIDGLLAEGRRLTKERLERLRTSPSLRSFMRHKPK
jgi:HTH-type transcriptional regulator, competence development regulator